jgi:hypothetical protein
LSAVAASAQERLFTAELTPRYQIDAAPGDDELPAIATNGDGYLVVWSPANSQWRAKVQIRAARLSHSGELLDPLGIPLGTGKSGCRSVVWSGEFYLVSWCDTDPSGATTTSMRRVAPDGTLLEAAPVTIADWNVVPPVWNGHRFLLFSGGGSTPLWGRFFDRELQLIGEPFIASPPLAYTYYGSYSARFDGTNFVIVFGASVEGWDGVFATVVSPTGDIIAEWQPLAMNARWPKIGGIGSRSYVGWTTSDGSVLAEYDGSSIVHGPVIVSLSPSHIVCVSEERSSDTVAVAVLAGHLRIVRFSDALDRLADESLGNEDVGALVLNAAGSGGAAYFANTGLSDPSYRSIYFKIFGRSVNPQSTLVSRAPSLQKSPAVAFNGTNFVAAWMDRLGDSYGTAIRTTRIDANGTSLDGEGYHVDGLFEFLTEEYVGISARDGLSLVTWTRDEGFFGRRSIFGAKMDSEGRFFDVGFALATGSEGRMLRSAGSRTHFLTLIDHPDARELYVAATPREGTLTTSQLLFTKVDPYGWDIACGNDECLAAGVVDRPDIPSSLETIRISNDGIPIESIGRSATDGCAQPSLASDGSSFLLVCTWGSVLRAALIRDGIAGPSVTISTPDDYAEGPDVVWTGLDYAIVWRSFRMSDASLPARLMFRRVSRDGVPFGSPEEIVTTALLGDDQNKPRDDMAVEYVLESRGHGNVTLIWTRHAFTLDVLTERLWITLREPADEGGRKRVVRRP